MMFTRLFSIHELELRDSILSNVLMPTTFLLDRVGIHDIRCHWYLSNPDIYLALSMWLDKLTQIFLYSSLRNEQSENIVRPLTD